MKINQFLAILCMVFFSTTLWGVKYDKPRLTVTQDGITTRTIKPTEFSDQLQQLEDTAKSTKKAETAGEIYKQLTEKFKQAKKTVDQYDLGTLPEKLTREWRFVEKYFGTSKEKLLQELHADNTPGQKYAYRQVIKNLLDSKIDSSCKTIVKHAQLKPQAEPVGLSEPIAEIFNQPSAQIMLEIIKNARPELQKKFFDAVSDETLSLFEEMGLDKEGSRLLEQIHPYFKKCIQHFTGQTSCAKQAPTPKAHRKTKRIPKDLGTRLLQQPYIPVLEQILKEASPANKERLLAGVEKPEYKKSLEKIGITVKAFSEAKQPHAETSEKPAAQPRTTKAQRASALLTNNKAAQTDAQNLEAQLLKEREQRYQNARQDIMATFFQAQEKQNNANRRVIDFSDYIAATNMMSAQLGQNPASLMPMVVETDAVKLSGQPTQVTPGTGKNAAKNKKKREKAKKTNKTEQAQQTTKQPTSILKKTEQVSLNRKTVVFDDNTKQT